MSLLNDALRAAEQRQNRPDVTAAYTGQRHVPPKPRRWRLPVVLLVVPLVVAAAGYGVFFGDATTGPTVVDSVERPTVADVADSETAGSEPVSQAASPASVAHAEDVSTTPEAGKVASEAEPTPNKAEPRKLVSAKAAQPQEAVAVEKRQPVAQSKPSVAEVRGVDQPERARVEAPSTAPAPSVKRLRETPEAVDLRVSRELAKLLRVGESRVAEQRLAELVARQEAPISREVFARAMLVQEMPARALQWLSGADAQAHPALRLLQARAQLALGRLDAALMTLTNDIPEAREHPEYRVTLATLLQQSGQSVEAARHWSALIAVDDSRPAWWVGLAIALESRGEVGGAVKAYAQAAQLPGLSPSLADYVRDRLNTLQAG